MNGIDYLVGMRRLIYMLLIFIFFNQGATAGQSTQCENQSYIILHVVLRKNVQKEAYDIVDKAKKAGFNTIMFTLVGDVALDNAPWPTERGDWSKNDLEKWVYYVRAKRMEIVPALNLLTHQEKFLGDRYPEFMYNKLTYDPRKDELYNKIIFPLLDELIAITKAKAFHIGHDEVKGERKLGRGGLPLPAELFVADVRKLHSYLRKKDVETWIWGDMLLSPEEFPYMNTKNMHGRIDGYGKEVRNAIPRDVVIVDWHYHHEGKSFDSMKSLQNEGFRVIGAGWKNLLSLDRFASYASRNNAYGMMVNTWGYFKEGQRDAIKERIDAAGSIMRRHMTCRKNK